MKEQKIIDVFTAHKIVQTDTPCEHCHGTLYRYYDSGEITCVKCQNQIQKAATQASEGNNTHG